MENDQMERLEQLNMILARACKRLKIQTLPRLRRGEIRCVDHQHFTSSTTLCEELKRFEGQGWVTYTDEVCQQESNAIDEQRYLLSGEWCNETQTLIARRDSTGWQTWRLDTIDSDESWISEVTHLRRSEGALIYEVCWQCDDRGARRPVSSRLTRLESQTPLN